MKLKYISPTRVKVLMVMFFGTGIIGMFMGIFAAPSLQHQMTLIITLMGVINFGLGAFFTFIFLTQKPNTPDKRKKKKKS